MKIIPKRLGDSLRLMTLLFLCTANTAFCPAYKCTYIASYPPIIEVKRISFKPYISVMANNNPFNIRRDSANSWVGKDFKNTEPFERFIDMESGIRAGIRLILNYNEKYGLNTIESILYKFAPPHENSTEAYINKICEETGFTRNQALDFTSKDVIIRLSHRIIRFETGREIELTKIENVYLKYFT